MYILIYLPKYHDEQPTAISLTLLILFNLLSNLSLTFITLIKIRINLD